MLMRRPMPSRRSQLPPLDYLVAFEAAALLGGFTAAAEHLNLSQAAISRKIRLLEENLGQQLFTRGHPSVQLTPSGRTYLRSVRKALDEIAAASVAIRQGDLRAHVTIAATQSVATLWLLPRLPDLRRDLPGLDINLLSSDEDEACLAGDFDLVILRGEGRWSGYETELLLDEEVFPICSPGYAEQIGLKQLPDLDRCTLIEVASHHTEWMNWRAWLAEFGEVKNVGAKQLTFNTYALAVQAACDGLGVALGWRHLVDAHLETGALVRPMARSVRTGSGYYMLSGRGHARLEMVEVLRDWLLASVSASPAMS